MNFEMSVEVYEKIKSVKGRRCVNRNQRENDRKKETSVIKGPDTRDTSEWKLWSLTQIPKTDTSNEARVNLAKTL